MDSELEEPERAVQQILEQLAANDSKPCQSLNTTFEIYSNVLSNCEITKLDNVRLKEEVQSQILQ